MTFIRPFSDIHLEFMDYDIPPMQLDKETYLVLAGDIGVIHGERNKARLENFLKRVSSQFLSVIIILGNHEFYNGAFTRTIEDMRAICAAFKNVHFLNNESIEFEDAVFIGSTLWTSCSNGSGLADFYWKDISDSRVIRYGPPSHPYHGKFLVGNQLAEHLKGKRFINFEVKKFAQANKKVVVVAHHGISAKSIAPQYTGDIYNMFFVEELTNFFMDLNPDLIVHGHVHNAFDYYLDDDRVLSKTRVVVNPRGYIGHEEPPEDRGFDEYKFIEL